MYDPNACSTYIKSLSCTPKCPYAIPNSLSSVISMQSAQSSTPSAHESGMPPAPREHLPASGFTLNAKDADVLKRYLDEWKSANMQARRTIYEKSMGEIYKLRPGNSAFSKRDAKEVFVLLTRLRVCVSIEPSLRKYGSGSTITLLLVSGR